MSEEEATPASVWIGLTLLALVSFWCQATVTEERLVPALNVIADYYNIPDDIAGATLMAAGASSPELFSSIVSLFITHSSLGLGTIVGSEIFNQLVICAGAVYASKTGKLQLDRAIVTREVGFYALAIILLYMALQDVEPVDGDDEDHIFISFADACMIFSGYIAYVIVCANMESIVSFCKVSKKRLVGEGRNTSYGSIGGDAVVSQALDVPDLPFIMEKKNLTSEPASNWATVSYFIPKDDKGEVTIAEGDRSSGRESLRSSSISSSRGSFMARSLRSSVAYTRSSILVDFFEHTERPSKLHDLYYIEYNEYTNSLDCFLWQQSYFYTKAYFGSNAWHLRWFSFTAAVISSVPDRQNAEDHKMTYAKFNKLIVDEERLIIKIVNTNPKRRNYTVMAPSKAIFEKVIQQLEGFMQLHSTDEETSPMDTEEVSHFDGDADHHVDLIEFPSEGTNVEIFFWLALSPLRFAMHYTIPDVRQLDEHGHPKTSVGVAFMSTLMCLVWLILGSYAMVTSLEDLAELLSIPDAVVGVTVSAAGTSLPNYIASKVAAENGFGNQAVSNAFGSNTFNIMVGLGLPWVLYTSFGTRFEPYHGLRNDGIVESIVILALVLLLFIGLMFHTGFVLYKWHGILFIGLYAAYLALAIGQVYLG